MRDGRWLLINGFADVPCGGSIARPWRRTYVDGLVLVVPLLVVQQAQQHQHTNWTVTKKTHQDCPSCRGTAAGGRMRAMATILQSSRRSPRCTEMSLRGSTGFSLVGAAVLEYYGLPAADDDCGRRFCCSSWYSSWWLGSWFDKKGEIP